MKKIFTIKIVHGLDELYPDHEFCEHELEVEAEGYDDAVILAEQQYLEIHPEMAVQIKQFGCSFYQE